MGRPQKSGKRAAAPGIAKHASYLPWIVGAAVAAVAAFYGWGGESGAAQADISSMAGKALARTGQLMVERDWKVALRIALRHTNGSWAGDCAGNLKDSSAFMYNDCDYDMSKVGLSGVYRDYCPLTCGDCSAIPQTDPGVSTPDTSGKTLCATDEMVSSNACVACPAGTTNAAGDDASGEDTTCDVACVDDPNGDVSQLGDPQLLAIMSEVATGIQERLGRGGYVPQRKIELSGLGGPLGDALASVARSGRPLGRPFRFDTQFEAQRLPLPLEWPHEVADGEPTPELTLLSAKPMVLMVDNWLSGAANASLDHLPADFDAAKASALQPATKAEHLGTAPKLCINKVGTRFAEFSAVVTRCVDEAMAAEADDRPHCAATAALGRRKGGPMSAFKHINKGAKGTKDTVCGPLTKALEEELVRSDNVLFDPGASDTVDTIDAAISAMLGFEIDVEGLAAAAPGAVASFLKNDSSTSTRARDAVRDAYSFATGPQLSRYRTSRRGGFRMHTDCHDFGLSQATERTHTAILYVSEPSGGGETVFPALGQGVVPKRGRLLIFENLLPDGTCDPRTAHASADLLLGASSDKLVVQKWFYLDRTHTEYIRKTQWNEGAPREPASTVCFNTDCRSQERVPADAKTLALLKKDLAARIEKGGPPIFG